MEMEFDEVDETLESNIVDVCPSCGILLVHGKITDGCEDEMGCAHLRDDPMDEDEDWDDEDYEDELLEELNFDD